VAREDAVVRQVLIGFQTRARAAGSKAKEGKGRGGWRARGRRDATTLANIRARSLELSILSPFSLEIRLEYSSRVFTGV
jgi:hypothetical protein